MTTRLRPTPGRWSPLALAAAMIALLASLLLSGAAQSAEPQAPRLAPDSRPLAIGTRTSTRTPTARTRTPTPTRTPTRRAQQSLSIRAYLPAITGPTPTPNYEGRALWVTRYDWTTYGQAPRPETIERIVDQAANAGFNIIFFQVRAHGDAYYTPGLEPWASRLTGTNGATLGQDPGWDPLAHMLARAHARGLQVHAYLNVYPAWLGTTPPPHTSPEHIFWAFSYRPGSNWAYWRQWDRNHQPMNLTSNYLWASPGVEFVEEQAVAVVRDVAARYAIDGLHLDLLRYAGANYSCDPRSEARYGGTCFSGSGYPGFQRGLITNLVSRLYHEARPLRPGLMLSAAVWWYPIDQWGYTCSEGYNDYYQNSYRWIEAGVIDTLAPMLYGCPALDNLGNWTAVMHDFQAHRAGRYIFPGIETDVSSFAAIADRIAAARAAGTAGHALFSYTGLNSRNYWDDLMNGPYAQPAAPPPITWP